MKSSLQNHKDFATWAALYIKESPDREKVSPRIKVYRETTTNTRSQKQKREINSLVESKLKIFGKLGKLTDLFQKVYDVSLNEYAP